ncbi:hypothetical protein [Pseudobutyrivibrio ruminis]|uniref:Uncharacterized protein n=1 Tax=Pseudobutyrivibrio ruminis DSM 9787 TaxID=1123011 RepID=A0A285T4V7_9FIRM|nr:hypothetical protein [Pseudobutyrivibrio ruminis]SOC16276.1 hypothetical protein SAMN02910411_0355 [Pseudobutyrivibrio ruminis DSM 9787]
MDKFIDYVEGTKLFTEFFANLPTPLNNVYFLILVAGIVVVMLFSNFIDMIFVNLRHRQIVKKAAEKPVENNPVNENVLGFMAAMQYAFMTKQKQREDVVNIEEQPTNFIEQKESYFEATMREQRQKDLRKKQLFEQKEAARIKAEKAKYELTKEEELLNER